VIDGDCIDLRSDLRKRPKHGRSPSGSPVTVRDRPPTTVEQLKLMGEAAIRGGTTELHYPDLIVVILGVLRYPVEDDEDGSAREAVARQIWDANKVSRSLADAKFRDLIEKAAGRLRFDDDTGQIKGPGSFLHYARKGGWSEVASVLYRMNFDHLFQGARA
jgi:hypothetical protein